MKKFSSLVALSILFCSLAVTQVLASANCIGNDYEQIIPRAKIQSTLPLVEIQYNGQKNIRDFGLNPSETVAFDAFVETLDSQANPFYLWCTNGGELEIDSSARGFESILFTAPSEIKKPIQVFLKMGDSLGYVTQDVINIKDASQLGFFGADGVSGGSAGGSDFVGSDDDGDDDLDKQFIENFAVELPYLFGFPKEEVKLRDNITIKWDFKPRDTRQYYFKLMLVTEQPPRLIVAGLTKVSSFNWAIPEDLKLMTTEAHLEVIASAEGGQEFVRVSPNFTITKLPDFGNGVTVAGRVFDESGAAMGDIDVSLRTLNRLSIFASTARTNEQGYYEINNFHEGDAYLLINEDGYKAFGQELSFVAGEFRSLENIILEKRPATNQVFLRSCREYFDNGRENDGYYYLDSDGPEGLAKPYEFFCDMEDFRIEKAERLREKNKPGLRMRFNFNGDLESNASNNFFKNGYFFEELKLIPLDPKAVRQTLPEYKLNLFEEAPSFVEGKHGQALQVKYKHRGVVKFDNEQLLDQQQVAITAWVKPQIDILYSAKIVEKPNYVLGITNAMPFCQVKGVASARANVQLAYDQWSQLACSYDNDKVLRLYLDGILLAEAGASDTADLKIEKQDVILAKSHIHPELEEKLAPNDKDLVVYLLDDLRVYNRSLSAREIRFLKDHNQDFVEAGVDEFLLPEENSPLDQHLRNLANEEESVEDTEPIPEKIDPRAFIDPKTLVFFNFNDIDSSSAVTVDLSSAHHEMQLNKLRAVSETYPGSTLASKDSTNKSAYTRAGYAVIPGEQAPALATEEISVATWFAVTDEDKSSVFFNFAAVEVGMVGRTYNSAQGGFYPPKFYCRFKAEKGEVYLMRSMDDIARAGIDSSTDNGWRHLACSYDGKKAKFFLNGHKMLDMSVEKGPIKVNGQPMLIGLAQNIYDARTALNPLSYVFSGYLDDVMLLTRAFDDKEPAAIYYHKFLPDPTTYVSFDQVNFDDLLDFESNSEFEHYSKPETLLHLKFKLGKGNYALDYSSNLNHAVIENASWVADTHNGTDLESDYSMHFERFDDGLIMIPDLHRDGFEAQLNQISYGAWFKPTQIRTHRTVINKGHRGHNTHAFSMGITSSHKAFCELVTENGLVRAESLNALLVDRWHHTFCNYDGQALEIFVDNKKDNVVSHSGRVVNTDAPVIIGSELNYVDSVKTVPRGQVMPRKNHFVGNIDEVFIANRAVADWEVSALQELDEIPEPQDYVKPFDINKDSLLYLKFDEGQGSLLRSSAGKATATFTSSAINWSLQDLWLKGVQGSALSFRGREALKINPNGDNFAINSSAISIGAWVYSKSFDIHQTVISSDYQIAQYDSRNAFSLSFNDQGQAVCTVGTDGFGLVNDYSGFQHFQKVTSHQKIPAHEWHQFICSYDGEYLRLFIDGQNAMVNWQTRSENFKNFKAPLRGVVKNGDISIPATVRGIIDEVFVTREALDSQQALEIYNQTVSGTANAAKLEHDLLYLTFDRSEEYVQGYSLQMSGRQASCPKPYKGGSVGTGEPSYYKYITHNNNLNVKSGSIKFSARVSTNSISSRMYRKGTRYVPPDQVVFSKGEGSNKLYEIRLKGKYPIPQCMIKANGSEYTVSGGTHIAGYNYSASGPWTELACDYEADTGRFRLLVNGQAQGQISVPKGSFKDDGNTIYLGANGGRTEFFSGCIDDVRIIDSGF